MSVLKSKKNLIASLSTIKIFLKTKIKSKIKNSCDKEISKADSNHTCLAVITLDSTLNKNGDYYPQLFLKECKYMKK